MDSYLQDARKLRSRLKDPNCLEDIDSETISNLKQCLAIVHYYNKVMVDNITKFSEDDDYVIVKYTPTKEELDDDDCDIKS